VPILGEGEEPKVPLAQGRESASNRTFSHLIAKTPMKYLPLGLNVSGKKCVVVGGGKVGTRKVETLLRAGATVLLVAPEASSRAVRLAETGQINWIRDAAEERHLGGALLAVVATDDEGENARLVEAAKHLGVLTCDASSAERSEIIFGALHVEEGLTIGVFTDGENPSRARATRDDIAAFVSGGRRPETPVND